MAPQGYSLLYHTNLSDLSDKWLITQRQARKNKIIREAYAAGIR